MTQFITESGNLPFSVALGLMFALALLEGVGTLLGLGISNLIEQLVPDLDLDADLDIDLDADVDVDVDMDVDLDADVDADLDADGDFHIGGGFAKVLSWLQVGRVPILILFVIFLTAFSLVGYFIQAMALKTLGTTLPALLASVGSFVVSLPMVRFCGKTIARVLPKEETSAISERSFVGRVATVTLGTARVHSATQAKLRDEYGQIHYLMVEPDNEEETFSQGSSVLIVRQTGAIFKVIEAENTALVD